MILDHVKTLVRNVSNYPSLKNTLKKVLSMQSLENDFSVYIKVARNKVKCGFTTEIMIISLNSILRCSTAKTRVPVRRYSNP